MLSKLFFKRSSSDPGCRIASTECALDSKWFSDDCSDSNLPVTGRKLNRWSGLATKVQRKSGFFFGVEQETIQRRSDAGFSQTGRCPQVLETVPFVDVFAQKLNDRDMLGSDFPAGESFGTRCTH